MRKNSKRTAVLWQLVVLTRVTNESDWVNFQRLFRQLIQTNILSC